MQGLTPDRQDPFFVQPLASLYKRVCTETKCQSPNALLKVLIQKSNNNNGSFHGLHCMLRYGILPTSSQHFILCIQRKLRT